MDTEILKDEDGAAPSTAPVHYILDEANVPMMSNLLNLFAFIEDFRTFLEVPEVPFTVCSSCTPSSNTTLYSVRCARFVNSRSTCNIVN